MSPFRYLLSLYNLTALNSSLDQQARERRVGVGGGAYRTKSLLTNYHIKAHEITKSTRLHELKPTRDA